MWKVKCNLIILFAALFIVCPALKADWPMAGANPERTSWVSDEIKGAQSVVWYRPIEPYISQNVQITAAAGKLFVATAKGVYALNASTGAVDWVYATEMPMGHSPTYDNGVLYVGGFDRKLHAIDATNGSRLWTYEATAGFRTSPLVADSLVMLGNRNGTFYAIHKDGTPNEGTLAWSYETDGPILYSAAYSNGVVFFTSQDMHCYALYTSDGSEKWVSSKLHGQGFNSFWPVIYRNRVVLTTRANYRSYVMPGAGSCGVYHMMSPYQELDTELINGIERDEIWPSGGDWIGTVGNEPGDWASGTTTINSTLAQQYFTSKPHRRNRYFLNINTGVDEEIAPILTLNTKNGVPTPPVVSGYDDVIYMGNTFKWNVWICRGGISGWKFQTPFISYLSEGAVDEPRIASGGGSMLYISICCDREARGLDLSSPGTRWNYWQNTASVPGTNLFGYAPGYDVMWFAVGDQDGTNNRLWGHYGSPNGIYHDGTGDQNPLIPYNGHLYIHRSNAIICLGPEGGSNGLSLSPIQTPAPDTPVEFNETQLKQMLADEIQNWLTAGHLQPGWCNPGQFGGQLTKYHHNLQDYYRSTAENIWVLLRALPHLEGTLQTNARNFIQSEYNSFPLTTYDKIGWNSGATRDWFTYPPEVQNDLANYGPTTISWHFEPFNYYVLWKYAQEFGGALTLYNAVKSSITNIERPSDSEYLSYPFWLNEYIAGYWGYLELEALAGQPETTAVRNTLNTMLDFRKNNFTKDTPFSPSSGETRLNISRNWIWLTPELAGYMRDNILSQVQTAVDEYEYIAPYWFVSRYEGCLNESGIQNLYDIFALFQAKAWILEESREELMKCLDVPGFMRGDVFYIHNLISAIEATSGGNQAPSVDAGTNQAITLPDNDVNLDGTVSDDGLPDPPAAVTVTWSKDTGPGTVTFANDNAIDTGATFSTDGVYVLRLTADDSDRTSSDTVTITVNPSGPSNQAPTVDAGSNQAITLPDNDVNLDGTVNDDGLPNPPATVTQTWTKESGSGTVTFGNANAVDTAATFSTDGVYVLRLTASDSALQAYDEVTITVNPSSGLTADANANPTSGTAPLQVQFTGSASGGQGSGGSNLLTNPGFETGDITGWTFSGTGGSVVSSGAHSGTYAVQMSGDGSVHQDVKSSIVAGIQYTFRAYVRVTAETTSWGQPRLRASFWPDLGSSDYGEAIGQNSIAAGWQLLEFTHTFTQQEIDGATWGINVGVINFGFTGGVSISDDLEVTDGTGGSPTYTYDWDFDNGDYSQDQNPLYTFNSQGTYNVELAVSDGYTIAYDYVTIQVSPPSDTTPPTPDPLTWATVPHSTGTTSISMTATTASDPSGVEYFFDCTAGGGNDSGWQDATTYEDTGLSPSTQYTYRVQARDKSANQNAGGWSTSESATTDTPSDTTPPTPNPLTWATLPHSTGTTSISMTATTASDPSGVEYYFDCTAGAGHDSGWQDSTTYEDTGLSPSTQYTYRVQARDKSTNQNAGGWSTSESATTDTPADTTPPAPDPLTWATLPHSTGTTSISMTATTASDPSGVEYYFDCTAGAGHDSGWQDSTTYQDTGLSPATQYTYRVQARDKSPAQNATAWSTSESATTDAAPDTTPPTPDPLTWATLPHSTGTTSISMTATTASDPSGVEYFFDCTAGGGNDSGWQDGTTYEDTGLSPSTQYTYRVQARDKSANQNAGGWSTSESATTDTPSDTTPPTPDPLTWTTLPHSTGTTSISMTATTASDPSGVEYFFDCTAGGGNDSGWQDGTTYEDTGLSPSTQYTYRVQARDKSANQNAGGWSTSQSATTDTPPDTTPPTPDPLTWATVPYSTGTTSISMTATTASDPSGVEYYFDCTAGAGGHDSGWQDNTTYQDTGLTPSTQYSYRVQARDKSANQNAGGWSTSESATTNSSGQTELLSDGFETNFDKWTDGGTTDWDRATDQKVSGTYSAHAGSSDNDLISDNLNAAGYSSITISFWYRDDDIDDNDNVYLQLYDGNAYVDRFELGNSTEDTWNYYEETINNSGGDAAYFISNFRIKFEGSSIDKGENLWIDDVLITAEGGTPPDTTPPTPDPLVWATVPYSTGTTSISMTATTASDASGVEYYFECTAGGGNDSAWQAGTTYEDTGLSPNTQYTYRVKARDLSANQNETAWSTAESATTDPAGGAEHVIYDGALQNTWALAGGLSQTTFQSQNVLDASGGDWSWHQITAASGQDVSACNYFEYEVYFDSAGSGSAIEWHVIAPTGQEWNGTYNFRSPCTVDSNPMSLPQTLSLDTWHTVQLDCSAQSWWAADSDTIQYVKWQWPSSCTAYIRSVKFVQ